MNPQPGDKGGEMPEELINQVHNKLVLLWGERIPRLATLDEAEEQERIMAEEIIRLVLAYGTPSQRRDEPKRREFPRGGRR